MSEEFTSELRSAPVQYTRYPRRRIVGREAQVQTYRVFVKLECGHDWSFTVTARRWRDGKLPKSIGCPHCPGVPTK